MPVCRTPWWWAGTRPASTCPTTTSMPSCRASRSLIGIGAVDPALQGEAAALAEVERAVKVLGLAGIGIEPGFGQPPRHPDDAVYFPIYERAQQWACPCS